MIKLKNIVNEGNVMTCQIYPEDSIVPGKIKVDCQNEVILSIEFPKGYEWCKNHLEHAKEYLIKLYSSKEEIPSEKLLMWY